jgi:hypothetical protein
VSDETPLPPGFTEAIEAGTAQDLILPILGTLAKRMLSNYAAAHLPAINLGTHQAAKSPKSTFLKVYRELIQGYLHEEGHARAMLHLDPSADPVIRMVVEPMWTGEGVGIEMKGGMCATEQEFDDPHERIMVSVAGFLAETVALGRVLPEGNPFRLIAGSLTPLVVTGLWMADDFTRVFPGCNNDHQELIGAVQGWAPPLPPNASDDDREQACAQVVDTLAGRIQGAVAAALRVIEAQAEDIVRVATKRADAHLAVITKAMAGIAGHVDAMRNASMGAFTPEAAASLAASFGGREPKTVWKEVA